MLHLWRTSVACWIVWGKTLLCLIFYPLFSWGFITYGICGVPLLVLCIKRLLHVVSMILGRLDYCGLLFLSLVGLMVCGCNQILHICVYRLIGGDEFMIIWAYLYWLLPYVVICTKIRGGSLYLWCIVPLWSGFWKSRQLSLHCLPCDYLGYPTGTWCQCLQFLFKICWCFIVHEVEYWFDSIYF